MYTLSLTSGERQAIDHIGGRYAHGHDLFSLLTDFLKEDEEWSSDDEITFELPEWAAWTIMDIAEECDHTWDCFGEQLFMKMEDFVSQIV